MFCFFFSLGVALFQAYGRKDTYFLPKNRTFILYILQNIS